MFILSPVFLAFILCYAQARSVPGNDEPYEAQLERIVEEMSECMDKNLEPVISQLSQFDQSQWKHMGISAISTYVRQLAMLANEQKSQETRRQPPRTADDEYDDHEYFDYHPEDKDYGHRFEHDDDESPEEDTSEDSE